jgi:hypothetical protein
MMTVQQRVREVLGADYQVDSKYESGRGGHSYMWFKPLKNDWNIIDALSSKFETWKLVRQIADRTYITHIFIVRSKKGILRGSIAYNGTSLHQGTNLASHTIEVDNWRVIHDMAGFHESNKGMEGVVSYEKI